MTRKLGINMDFSRDITPHEAIDLIAKTGFEATFTLEYDTEKVRELKEHTDRCGISFETIHAPFDGINAMWESTEDEPDIMKRMKAAISAAGENAVPIVIIHVSSGWDPPSINDAGLARFDALVDYAKEKGVTVAFENLRVLGNVAYFTDRYRYNENVRFCFDAGHEHCNTKTVSWIDIFGKRLITTHIHDNFGRGEDVGENFDMHLLPFDGNYDYENMMHRLDKYSYSGTLMLEVFTSKKEEYLKMTPEDFLREAYLRLEKISKL